MFASSADLGGQCRLLLLAKDRELVGESVDESRLCIIESLNDLPKSKVITFSNHRFFEFSILQHQCLYINLAGIEIKNQMYAPNQMSIKIGSTSEIISQLGIAIQHWSKNRIGEFSLIRGGHQSQFFQVVKNDNFYFCQSSVNLHEELNFIRQIIAAFRLEPDHRGRPYQTNHLEVIFRQEIDSFSKRNAISTLLFISTGLTLAHENQKRLFQDFENDYYKITIGHEILDQIFAQSKNHHLDERFARDLSTFQDYLFYCQEKVEGEYIVSYQQGDN